VTDVGGNDVIGAINDDIDGSGNNGGGVVVAADADADKKADGPAIDTVGDPAAGMNDVGGDVNI
jgi:hypothetical protein